ncbi:MAG: bi-domain-containing oxidoreductase [Saprospiraceae bacterium]
MKQIIQDIKNGETILVETPAPIVQKGHVLIKSHYSLISTGTERMLLDFGKAGWLAKARQQPERVQQVLSKIKSDGLMPTVESVLRKLDTPIPLGYCNAGEVIGVGEGVNDFRIGDRVVSNGSHAEIVSVGKNLVARIPDSLSYEEAAFTIIGAIALQGIRLTAPNLGETIVVQGLGLIGMLTAQLLKSNGCEVIGLDMEQSKVEMANSFGIHSILVNDENSAVNEVLHLTKMQGADAVIMTASSKSDILISQAAQMSRKRGRIVLVGVVGLDINRSDFYEKELSFQVSCSYGPGRYDDTYEKAGIDYPYAYVRWTEQRNFEAVLKSMESQSLKVKDLISEIVLLNDYQEVYQNLSTSKSMASLIKYDVNQEKSKNVVVHFEKNFKKNSSLIGIIGAGNFTSATMLPLLYKLNAPIKSIASQTGLTATQLAKKYYIPVVSTDYNSIIEDSSIGSVVITTRHHTHANLVSEALKQNKHVFVEKPLAINRDQLQLCIDAMKETSGSLTIGFNRRFSPASKLLKAFLEKSSAPIQLIMTMNAGFLPEDHWTQNMEIGGGRIIGEACHFFDLANYLVGSLATRVVSQSLGTTSMHSDNVNVLIKYANGSTAAVNYFSNGNKDYPKERIEAYQNNVTAVIDNFKKLNFFGTSAKEWSGNQDKGHKDQYSLWLKFIEEGGPVLIDVESLVNTSQVSFAAVDSLMSGKEIDL